MRTRPKTRRLRCTYRIAGGDGRWLDERFWREVRWTLTGAEAADQPWEAELVNVTPS